MAEKNDANRDIFVWVVGVLVSIMLVFVGGFGTYVVGQMSHLSKVLDQKLDTSIYVRDVEYLRKRQDDIYNLLWMKYPSEVTKIQQGTNSSNK